MASFPTSRPSFTAHTSNSPLSSFHSNHHDDTDGVGANLIAVADKLGLGASTPERLDIMAGTGTGTSAWSGALDVGIVSRSACQRLLKKLYRDAEDAVVVVIGDSASAGGSASWPGMLGTSLATRYPTFTVKIMAFNDTTKAYDAATTLATGSGANTLWILNGAVAGMNISYQRDYIDEVLFGLDTLPVGINAKQPDLVFISHGHNEPPGFSGVGLPQRWDQRQRMNLLLQLIRAHAPQTGIAVILENEITSGTDRVAAQHVQQDAYAMAAQDSGADVIDVWQAFHDTGSVSTYLADGIHPNTAGRQLIRDLLLRYLNYGKDASVTPSPPSSILNPTVNLLQNGAFSQFSAPPTLPGWTATHLTLSKDTTHFESQNGYALRAVGDGSAGLLQALLSNGLSKELRSRWITLLVRQRVTAGSYAGTQPGVVNLASMTYDGSYHVVYEQDSQPIYRTDAFVWNSVSLYVDPTTDYVRVLLKPDYATGSTIDVTFDRVILVPGVLPRDVPRTTLMADMIAAGQVPFPATQIASTDPNVLDDYEERDWVPVLAFGGSSAGITYGNIYAHCTKIGRLVVATGDVTLTSKGSATGNATLAGLPFANGTGGITGSVLHYYANFSGLTGNPRIEVVASASAGTFYQSGTAATTVLTDAAFTNTTRFTFILHYTV